MSGVIVLFTWRIKCQVSQSIGENNFCETKLCLPQVVKDNAYTIGYIIAQYIENGERHAFCNHAVSYISNWWNVITLMMIVKLRPNALVEQIPNFQVHATLVNHTRDNFSDQFSKNSFDFEQYPGVYEHSQF